MKMKMKNNKTCIVCSKEYTFCSGCGDYDHLPRWYAIYHDENCKNIFEVASDYLAEDITKDEALERFDECDLSNQKNFHPAIVKAINDVYDIEEEKEECFVEEEELDSEDIDEINSEE